MSSYQDGSAQKSVTMSRFISMVGSQQVKKVPAMKVERREALLKHEAVFIIRL